MALQKATAFASESLALQGRSAQKRQAQNVTRSLPLAPISSRKKACSMANQPLPPALQQQTPPDPKKHPLKALKYILRIYLLLGGPAHLRLPARFVPLKHVWFAVEYFLSEGYVSTHLCILIPGYLLMSDRQHARKKACGGGWAHPNRFTKADVAQEPAKREALERMTTDALYHRFGDELRLLIRLLRTAVLAYRRSDAVWEECHRAASIVLLRIAQISAVLRHRGSRFLAEECLRAQARQVWDELFAGAPPPAGPLPRRLCPMTMKPWGPYRITLHLLKEQEEGHPITAPFVEHFPRWAAQLRAGERVA
jgi:hypothetical protein